MLQRDINTLRSENAEYRRWLGRMKDAIPAIVPRINELKQQVATLQAKVVAEAAGGRANSSTRRLVTATLGSAYIDEKTGLIFTVLQTYPDETAKVSVHLPDKPGALEETIAPGHQWSFKARGQRLLLTVTSISFLGDTVDLQIAQAP